MISVYCYGQHFLKAIRLWSKHTVKFLFSFMLNDFTVIKEHWRKISYLTGCIQVYLISCMLVNFVNRVNTKLYWTSQPHRTHTHTVNSCRSGDVIFLRPMSSETFDTSNNLPCVCSEKEDSVTISDMDLDCVLQKREIEIFTEQSPPLSPDKMYPFPQMLVNSLNSAKTSMCRAHGISCTSESWLQTAKSNNIQRISTFPSNAQVFSHQQGSALISGNLTIHKNTSRVYKASQKTVYW